MKQEWSTHSGSRWEPLQPPDPSVGPSRLAGLAPRRRRRGPVLAALVTLLTLGTTSAGVAYLRAADEPIIDSPAYGANEQAGSDGRNAGPHRGSGQRADHGRPAEDQAAQRPGSSS